MNKLRKMFEGDNETKAPEKIIYADIMDCIILKENIKYKLAKGHIKEVLE